MKSILQMFKIGKGPSITLNTAAFRACEKVAKELKGQKDIDNVEVRLYNDFARLEEQVKTSQDILDAFKLYSKLPIKVVKTKRTPPAARHPLTFDILLKKRGEIIRRHRIVSTGGGNFFITDQLEQTAKSRYDFKSFVDMTKYFKQNRMSYLDFCSIAQTKKEITTHFAKCIKLMDKVIADGLKKRGLLKLSNPKIKFERRAKHIIETKVPKENDDQQMIRKISAYAYAIGEEIAQRSKAVISPSCGAAGVYWATLKFIREKYKPSTQKIYNAMCISGLIASLIDQNATISSADAGCQAEIGTACAMASATAAYLMYDANIDEIGRAAEMALEHCLGLTCCAICAIPLVPCIQRCAAYAVRAIENAVLNHSLMPSEDLCALDDVIKVMYETGKDLLKQHRTPDFEGFAKRSKYALR